VSRPDQGWTRANLRHVATLFRQGRNPAASVYESIGTDFFLALEPGWLNLGLWEGAGTPEEAPAAVRRLVRTLAADLPAGGVVLDVGNGLGAQDPLIAEVARPRRLVALNVTEAQLRVGAADLARAHAVPVAGDATRMPVRNGAVDGVISVEAAFHFASRRAFFAEVRRVLAPGGVLTMSDISTERLPRRPAEVVAGLTQLRIWGLRRGAVATAERIGADARAAGLLDVRIERCGRRVIAPAVKVARRRLGAARGVPASKRWAARLLLDQVELLWKDGLIEYILLGARAPA
jgi:MPBQ/MSBQ methyltransferase